MKPSDDLIVSSVEPTGLNRKKVWMQKGKNLYDKNKSTDAIALNVDTGKTLTFDGRTTSDYIEVQPNTQYVVSVNGKASTVNACMYDSNKDYIRGIVAATIKTTSDTKYIRFYHNTTLKEGTQFEQNSTATEYEEYIEPKIYIRNDTNVYEEFINKEKKNAYRITDEAEHSNGENNYTLRIQDELVIFSFNPLWINSITADTWVKLCSIPQEIIPNITVGNLALITDGGTGNIIGNAKIEVRADGGLYAKPNITKTSYVSGITGMLCWFIN